MLYWRVANHKEREMILSKNKKYFITGIGALILVLSIFLFLFLFIGIILQYSAERDKYYDILDYSIDNPPQFRDFHYIFGEDYEEIKNEYEIAKEEFYSLQQLEIENARKLVKVEISYKFYCYYFILIFVFIVIFIFNIKKSLKDLSLIQNNKYLLCDAVCVDKKVEIIYEVYKDHTHRFYMIVKTNDDSRWKIRVSNDLFNEVELGNEVLILSYDKSEKIDEMFNVYLPVR